jgi:hypothetical protein
MTKAEQAFSDEIDCRLPYRDLDRCKELTDRGIAISPNAAFCVLHEICRPPRSEEISVNRLLELLDYWQARFAHPVAPMLADVARSMIVGRPLSTDDAIERMRVLAEFPGLYAALAVLHFSCDDNEDRLGPIDAAIRRKWDAAPNAQ